LRSPLFPYTTLFRSNICLGPPARIPSVRTPFVAYAYQGAFLSPSPCEDSQCANDVWSYYLCSVSGLRPPARIPSVTETAYATERSEEHTSELQSRRD